MTSDLPLSRKRIVVTRTKEQSGSLTSMLEKLGAEVLLVPTIKIEAAELSDESLSLLNGFNDYDFAIFSSVNAVRNFFHFFKGSEEALHRPTIIAIGNKTRSVLEEYGYAADIVPQKFNKKDLLLSLQNIELNGKRILIPKGSLSGDELEEFVRAKRGIADSVVVYSTLPNESIDDSVKDEVSSGKFNIVIFYSPSEVKNFLSVFGSEIVKGKRIAVIGPTTKKAAEVSGLTVDIVPENSTTEGLIECLVEHEKNR